MACVSSLLENVTATGISTGVVIFLSLCVGVYLYRLVTNGDNGSVNKAEESFNLNKDDEYER